MQNLLLRAGDPRLLLQQRSQTGNGGIRGDFEDTQSSFRSRCTELEHDAGSDRF